MIPDISVAEIALRLVVAAALSGLVGLEREWRERAAGLRTHMLVGVGSALFTLISAYGFNDFLIGGSNVVVRARPAARPFAETTSAILRLASSIISSPSITAPRAPPAAEVWNS